ncbi:MAG: endolytic transglycosylase MltG [Thiohalocapsa sp.]|uniref:endolytic transglycosylase MltG n=1 Tax=Thiohalocapsa sp. TaxID=2497641 RepID=UPI0025ED3360|nr:endolytic transglycosylase MltG [Thiohalocapsa sp.]
MKTILSTLLVLVIAGGAAAWGGWTLYQDFLAAPVTLDQEQVVYRVREGATIRGVAHDLADRGWIPSRFLFTMHAYETEQQNALKAGEYAIEAGMTPQQVLALLTSGKSIQFPVTFVPGMTFREALAAIGEVGVFHIQLDGLSDAELAARLGIDAEHPEGWLFPDTYLFARDTSDVEILTRAHERMRTVLKEEWAERSDDLPVETPYEALILASIVEKETGKAGERPRIAGVFTRRLEQGMKLQTDPTVIYGLGDEFDGDITREHLRRETPYNTYVIPALPPTPIALPGREAIHAVLHPADGDELFFVARGDGSHYFSATLDEHNCAVRHYQLNQPCADLRDDEVGDAAEVPDDEPETAATDA